MLSTTGDATLVPMPGGGAYGRSARDDVRNPALGLPSAALVQAMPFEQRRPLGILLRKLADEADAQAHACWALRRIAMAAHWRATCTYCRHLGRTIDPIALRPRGSRRFAWAPPSVPPASATLRERRDPVLALPTARMILALEPELRRPLVILLRDLATTAPVEAATLWRQRKGPMAAYSHAVGVIAKHLARVIGADAASGTIAPALSLAA